MFKGPVISKGDGTLGAKAANTDNVFGLVMGGVTVAVLYPTLGVSVKLLQPKDADAYGLTAAYDTANKVLVRYHINEFFRINPNGTLWVMLVAQTITMANMVNVANNYLFKLINDSGKTIRGAGVVRNPATGYTPTLSGGFDNDVLIAVPLAQALTDQFALQNVYIDQIIIEGRQINGAIASISNLRNLASPNVSVVGAQDKDVAALDALFANTAAVGTLLGSIGVRRTEEDWGSLNSENNPSLGKATMPINDLGLGFFKNTALSSGVLVSTLTPNEVALLRTNAIIFADNYPDSTDIFFSGSHACTVLTSDYAFGVNTRVWNKGARIATKKIIPKFNSKVETDDAGNIATTTASEWQADINNSADGLGSMVTGRNCLKSAVYINPAQNIYSTSTLDVSMTIKPYGYARDITGKLSFSKT